MTDGPRWRTFGGSATPAVLLIAGLVPVTLVAAGGDAGGPIGVAAQESAVAPAIPPVRVIEARPGRDVAGSGGMIGFSWIDDGGTQVITLVNTQKMWMAVYHIGTEGEIRLTSSRPIDADFTLQLNATEPLPEQIRRLNGQPAPGLSPISGPAIDNAPNRP